MKKIFIILFFMSMLFCRCFSPNIPLSKVEKRYLSYLKKKYKCDVSFFHDFEAINGSKKAPTFWIELSDSEQKLCFSDIEKLKKIVVEIGKELNMVLKETNKIEYLYIEVVFRESIYPDKRSQDVVCSKSFISTMKNTNINNVQLFKQYHR